jgi:hypothetical protein
MRCLILAAISILLAGCSSNRAPTSVVPERPASLESNDVYAVDSTGLHIAPLFTRIRATRDSRSVRFAIRTRPRFAGDHPHYDPFVVGGYAFTCQLKHDNHNIEGYLGEQRPWIVGWNQHGSLTLWHGRDSLGTFPLRIGRGSLSFAVPLSLFPSADFPLFYNLTTYAAIGTYPGGIRYRVTDINRGSITERQGQ